MRSSGVSLPQIDAVSFVCFPTAKSAGHFRSCFRRGAIYWLDVRLHRFAFDVWVVKRSIGLLGTESCLLGENVGTCCDRYNPGSLIQLYEKVFALLLCWHFEDVSLQQTQRRACRLVVELTTGALFCTDCWCLSFGKAKFSWYLAFTIRRTVSSSLL